MTNDSLGLHIALALKKKVVALFGPTSGRDTHMFGCGVKIFSPRRLKCMPCYSISCKRRRKCMDYITPEAVAEKVSKLLARKERRMAFNEIQN